MTRISLMLLTLCFSIAFLFTPTVGVVGFPFSSVKLAPDTYLYFLIEHLILVVLSCTILVGAVEHRFLIIVFITIQLIDTLFYVLFYGDPFKELPVNWNFCKIAIFLIGIIYENRNGKPRTRSEESESTH